MDMHRAHRTGPAVALSGRAALTAAVILGFALGGCGSDPGGAARDPADTSPVPGAGDIVQDNVANAQDAAFATDMITHHRQSIEMARLARDHTKNEKVLALARQIESEQTPEVAEMTRWLTEWRRPVPAASASPRHVVPGMASPTDVTRLRTARDGAFDRTFLTLMIAHHEGGLSLARDEQRTGADERARGLAEDIATSDAAQIAQMKALLG
jgi:uncharacterized protein (DUF305 family)